MSQGCVFRKRRKATHSIVVLSEPSTKLPLMKTPVGNEVLPLYTGVSQLYEKTEGIVDEKKDPNEDTPPFEGLYICELLNHRS